MQTLGRGYYLNTVKRLIIVNLFIKIFYNICILQNIYILTKCNIFLKERDHIIKYYKIMNLFIWFSFAFQ